jgi:mannose-6-phosphate isomerase-like protein (cupin superfamily)
VVIEGIAQFTAGDETLEATQGEVIVVPGNTAHRFENVGDGRLLVASVHSHGRVIQENLE